MAIASALRREYDNELTTTRWLPERIPDATSGFRPHDKSTSMGQLAAREHAIRTPSRLSVARAILRTHIIHDRGQLSVCSRLNDVPLPEIDGPTADSSR